jgi:uncharacterized protein YndB with AHSA1/START domain
VARNTIHVDAPPEAVFDVLCDPRHYGTWVVGTSIVRQVEGRWPEPGSCLHHTQMMLVRDTTSVIACEPQRRLVLEVRARPFVIATVAIHLEPQDSGALVVLDETPTGGIAAALPAPLVDALIGLRNAEAVRRLKRLVEIGQRLGLSSS